MVPEEGAAVLAHHVVDGLTPPAGVSVTGKLQHQVPVRNEDQQCVWRDATGRLQCPPPHPRLSM